MSADRGVHVTHRRRRQITLDLNRARMHAASQPRRQRATHHQLALQPGRQFVALGQTGRQVVAMPCIPATQIAVMIAIVAAIVVAVVLAFIILVVPIGMPVALAMIAIVIVIVISESLWPQ